MPTPSIFLFNQFTDETLTDIAIDESKRKLKEAEKGDISAEEKSNIQENIIANQKKKRKKEVEQLANLYVEKSVEKIKNDIILLEGEDSTDLEVMIENLESMEPTEVRQMIENKEQWQIDQAERINTDTERSDQGKATALVVNERLKGMISDQQESGFLDEFAKRPGEEDDTATDKTVAKDKDFIGPVRQGVSGGISSRPPRTLKDDAPVTADDIKKIYSDRGADPSYEVSDLKLNEFMNAATEDFWQNKTKEEFLNKVRETVSEGIKAKTDIVKGILPTSDTEIEAKPIVSESIKSQVAPGILAGTLLSHRGKEAIEKGKTFATKDEKGKLKKIKTEGFGLAEGVSFLGKGSASDVAAYNQKAKAEGRVDWRQAYALDILGTTQEVLAEKAKTQPKKETPALNISDQEFFFGKGGNKIHYKDTFVNRTTGARTTRDGESVFSTSPVGAVEDIAPTIESLDKKVEPVPKVDKRKVERERLIKERKAKDEKKLIKKLTPNPVSSLL